MGTCGALKPAAWLASVILTLGLMAFGLTACEQRESSSPTSTGTSASEGAAPAGGQQAATSATNEGSGSGGAIKVGLYGSLTGSQSTFGQSTEKGVKLAVDKINAAGGVNGRKIEIVSYDSMGKPQEAGNAVTRLIESEKVVAVLGEVASSLSIAGGRVAQAKRVPMITPASTNPSVTQIGEYVSRVCFIDPFQGYVMAKFAREELDIDQVAVLFDQSQAYSKGLKDDFSRAFKSMGGIIVSEQAYSTGDTDFSAQLTSIRNAKPQAIFLPGYYNDVGNIALQARRLGITAPFLGSDGWTSDKLTEIAGDALNGSFYSDHTSPDDPRAELQAFRNEFRARYNESPDSMAALGYDAALVLADALKRAGTTSGPELARAIADTKDFPGVTGVITIDKDRNARKSAVVLEIKNRVPVFRSTIEPAGE